MFVIQNPDEGDWQKAKSSFSTTYDGGDGWYSEAYWLGLHNGAMVPHRRSDKIGEY